MCATLSVVMSRLDPGIHVFLGGDAWMVGASPAMAVNETAQIAET